MKMLLAILVFLPLTAVAQTYKCVEKGKSVYSDRPCSDSAIKLNIGDSADETERLRQEALKREEASAAMAAAVDKVRRESRREAPAPTANRNQPSAQDRRQEECARLIKTSKDASNEAELYLTPRFKADAKRRQKEADDEHFTKCYGTVSVK